MKGAAPPSAKEVTDLFKPNPHVKVDKEGTIIWDPKKTCPGAPNCPEKGFHYPDQTTKQMFKDGEGPCTEKKK